MKTEKEYTFRNTVSDNINHNLIAAIEAVRLDEVRKFLDGGADPNYDIGPSLGPDDCLYKPRTPLNTLVFCISNALLSMKQLEDYCDISRLLIERGAQTGELLEHTLERYGPLEEFDIEYPRPTAIKKVLLIISGMAP